MSEGEAVKEVLTPRERSLANLKSIKPGQVLNPRGAGSPAHSLAVYIRHKTLDGEMLVDFLLEVLHGNQPQFRSTRDKLSAVEMLFNRGWGHAPQTIAVIGKDTQIGPMFDLTKLTNAEFEQFKALAAKIGPIAEIKQESTVVQSVDTPPASTDAPVPTISPPSDPQVKP